MKALTIVAGDPPHLQIVQRATPTPGPHQVLVRVAASGLNRADLLHLRGNYPVPADAPPDIPGIEFAGTAEALGPDCSIVSRGERVFGLASGGAHAEYLVSPEELLMSVPRSLGDVEAGAVPEAFITAHDALFTLAALQPGERILIHAIGSGVGLAALQLAAAWGCQSFGTTRSQRKIAEVTRLRRERPQAVGSVAALLPDAFDAHILKETDGGGVDVILDPVGAPYFERNLNVLAPRGRSVCIATMGGSTVSLSLSVLQRKRLKLIGTVLRNRTLAEKVQATRAFERDVVPKIAAENLSPIVDRSFSLEQAPDAYKYMEENRNFGKIVLTMG